VTLDTAISELQKLRSECGGETELVSSRGAVGFMFVNIGEDEETYVAVTGESGVML